MFQEEFLSMCNAAKAKSNFLRNNPLGYFIASMLAGAFVGFGVLLVFSIGGQLGGIPATKLIMGVSFGIALSLVVIAGAELFTGNNLVMASGFMSKTVSLGEVIKLWIVCYLGNFAGSILIALIFVGTGLGNGAVGEFMTTSAIAKATAGPTALLFRGILCNVLVCLAVWCGFRCKSESGKLIMIFWCLFAFITTGFEHSIANMTLFTTTLVLNVSSALTVGGAFYNLALVTLGNMIGGILFLAAPYYIIARKKEV